MFQLGLVDFRKIFVSLILYFPPFLLNAARAVNKQLSFLSLESNLLVSFLQIILDLLGLIDSHFSR